MAVHPYYILNLLSLFWLAESVQWIWKSAPVTIHLGHSSLRTRARPQVTMSSSYDHDAWSPRVISLSSQLQLITPTSALIILDITKTSSDKCLTHWLLALFAKKSFLDILEIFRLEIGQISFNLVQKGFATWQLAFLATSIAFYDILPQAWTEIVMSFWQETDVRL